MALYIKGDNLWGFHITVWSSTGKTVSHGGWSEGSPALDATVRESLLKLAPTQALKFAVSGGLATSAVFLAAGIAGSTVGKTISAVVMQGLNATVLKTAKDALAMHGNTVGVILSGDFEASYKLKTAADLDALPGFLAIVPATFKADKKQYWMGKNVMRSLIDEQLGACITGKDINIRFIIDV